MGCDLPFRSDRRRGHDEDTRLSLMLEAYAISEPVTYPLFEDNERLFRTVLATNPFFQGPRRKGSQRLLSVGCECQRVLKEGHFSRSDETL
jgi:hypothetical protein